MIPMYRPGQGLLHLMPVGSKIATVATLAIAVAPANSWLTKRPPTTGGGSGRSTNVRNAPSSVAPARPN